MKGEQPTNFPVQAPTRFEMVVNLKTAKALSLEIPESFLGVERTSTKQAAKSPFDPKRTSAAPHVVLAEPVSASTKVLI